MLPDIKAVVGHLSQPLIPSLSNDSKLEQVGQKLERRDTKLDGGLTLFTPSDLSKVLYPESYDDFIRKRVSVEPLCHCWTPKQSVYVGCSGGQLLVMESDSGVTKLLANPQLIVSNIIKFSDTITIIFVGSHPVFCARKNHHRGRKESQHQ